jgi:malate dehydrogenase (quinone)
VIKQHEAKVYGKASVGAPPMSVPHLDTRIIDGKKALLFGPFAGFSTKFLKNGSYFDLPASIEFDNILPMLGVGIHNIPLTRYLIQQVTLSHEDRVAALKDYYPNARAEDWHLAIAGQRVQVIKRDDAEWGKLEFGTELVHSADGTLAALLGASPGASTAVTAMLEVLNSCFPQLMQSDEWKQKLEQMIPLYDESIPVETIIEHRRKNNALLHLDD